MLRLLRLLFTGDWHLHEWEDIRKSKLYDADSYLKGYSYVQKCKHCGKLQNRELRL